MKTYCLECHMLCGRRRLMETGYYEDWIIESTCCGAPTSFRPHGPQVTDEAYQMEHAAEAADRLWAELDERDRRD